MNPPKKTISPSIKVLEPITLNDICIGDFLQTQDRDLSGFVTKITPKTIQVDVRDRTDWQWHADWINDPTKHIIVNRRIMLRNIIGTDCYVAKNQEYANWHSCHPIQWEETK